VPKRKATTKTKTAKTAKRIGVLAYARLEAMPLAPTALAAQLNQDRAAFVAFVESEIGGAEQWLAAKGYTGGKRSALRITLPPPTEDRRPAETLSFIDAATAFLPILRRNLDAGDINAFDALHFAFEAGRAFGACFAYEAVSRSAGWGQWSAALDQFNDALAERAARGEKLPNHDQLVGAFMKFQRERGGETFATADKVAFNRFKKALVGARRRPRNETLRRTKKGWLPKP
jgi:hypothetical protein